MSSLAHDLSQSPSQSTQPRDLSPSASSSSLHTRSESTPPPTPNRPHENLSPSKQISSVQCSLIQDSDHTPRTLTQTGTQTSPESTNGVALKGHFSIGATTKDERVSPKMSRKDRGSSKNRPKRAISPANLQQLPSTSKVYPGNETVKTAMSPSVAESLRAVFAAFLWHEGIVHDAMACASFLKFHPSLPKQGALVVTRHGHPEHLVDKRQQELTREERARQRHSVEVSTAGTYLHIQPSTLETLTRSAANASANRARNRKPQEGVIKEEAEGYQTISVLPPALKSLVYLWEELSSSCLQAIMQQAALSSPSHGRNKNNERNGTSKESKEKHGGDDRGTRKSRKKKACSRNYLGKYPQLC